MKFQIPELGFQNNFEGGAADALLERYFRCSNICAN